jgi:hypothetical protein
MVMFFLSIPCLGHTSLLVNDQVVHRCIIPCILLYYIRGLSLPLLVEYSCKGDVNLTHLFCLKDANGSAHDRGGCPLSSRYVLVRPFFDEKEVTTGCSGLGVTLINY